MSFESSIKTLYNESGVELAVTQSQVITGSQPFLLFAGSGSQGQAIPFQVSNQGHLFVTGTLSAVVTSSVSVVFPVSQSVKDVAAPNTVLSSANASTVSFQLLPANQNRKIVTFYTDGTKTFYLGFGATPSITLFSIKLAPGTFFVAPDRFTGSVSVISNQNDTNSKIMVTEISY